MLTGYVCSPLVGGAFLYGCGAYRLLRLAAIESCLCDKRSREKSAEEPPQKRGPSADLFYLLGAASCLPFSSSQKNSSAFRYTAG